MIIDRLERAMRELDQADAHLAGVESEYYDAGAKEGAMIAKFRDTIKLTRETLSTFRYHHA